MNVKMNDEDVKAILKNAVLTNARAEGNVAYSIVSLFDLSQPTRELLRDEAARKNVLPVVSLDVTVEFCWNNKYGEVGKIYDSEEHERDNLSQQDILLVFQADDLPCEWIGPEYKFNDSVEKTGEDKKWNLPRREKSSISVDVVENITNQNDIYKGLGE